LKKYDNVKNQTNSKDEKLLYNNNVLGRICKLSLGADLFCE